MKLVIPKNLYSALFALSLPDEIKERIKVESSSFINREIESGNADIGLMPSCDLIKHKDLFISRRIGVSFDGLLSNAYIYLIPESREFFDIYLNGDISTNEIILTKILFKERFNSDISIHLDTKEVDRKVRNYVIIGNDNTIEENFKMGISFSDQIAEMLSRPYVNFVLASKEESALKEFTNDMNDWDKKIEDRLDDYLAKIKESEEVKSFIKSNFNSIYYEITENEIEALYDLLNLPFYHGMMESMIDLRWV